MAGRPVVGLNALFLDPGRSGGPETYLRGLVPALAQAAPHLELVVVTTRRGAAALREEDWGVRIAALPADDGQRGRRLLAEQLLLPARARRQGWAIVHSLASFAPLRVPGVRTVLTLHDVTFLEHRTFSPLTTVAMRLTSVGPARRADGLITATAAAGDQIARATGLEPVVVPHGGGRPPGPAEPVPGLPPGRLVLAVGAKRPHKNQAVLVRALRELPGEWSLVLAGHAEPYEHQLRTLAAELGVGERVRFLDGVTDAQLEGLYAAADVVALPTLAEGFGLPLLEALQRGKPIAASDIPVLHEVGGELPAWFDPHDPVSAARAILAARADPEAARAQAARFSWERCAQATAAVYDRVLACG